MGADIDKKLVYFLVLWAAVVLFFMVFLSRKHTPTVGLRAAYIINLSLNHWFGAFIYALPWYSTQDYDSVYLGFRQSLYGTIAFCFSSLVFTFLLRFFHKPNHKNKTYMPNPRLPAAYILTGLVFYALLSPVLKKIPSIGTFVQSGWSLLITGLCLACWKAWQMRKRKRLVLWLSLAVLFPIFTIINLGFLGWGIGAVLTVLVFVANFYRPKWKVAMGGVLAVYLGLSLFVTYLRDREELREIVWYERAPISARIESMSRMLGNFEFFSIFNDEHLWRIDIRLNQNILVGRAVEYIGSGSQDYAFGQTLWFSLQALVPRILWPNKPVVAGSMGLVSKYTGLTFAEGTSVGIGQVMEFYVNFGTMSVIIGFMILGIFITLFDVTAANHLRRGDWPGFTFWFLPGLGFMQTERSLIEVASTIAASIVFCILVNQYLLLKFSGKPMRQRYVTYS